MEYYKLRVDRDMERSSDNIWKEDLVKLIKYLQSCGVYEYVISIDILVPKIPNSDYKYFQFQVNISDDYYKHHN